jgi:hypothetical protein
MRTRIGSINTTAVAWFLVVIYAWLRGILQLTHTDDLRAFAPVSGSHSSPSLQAGKAYGPETICLAHEWSGVVHAASAPTIALLVVPETVPLTSVAVTRALHLLCFDHTPLRGPPANIA